MARLITPKVWTDIRDAASAATTPASVAVAYFGEFGDRLLPLPTKSTLVVDASIETVKNGSTDPRALRRLYKKGVEIFSAQFLHAKVFAFDAVGFVGSANASRNSETNLIEAVFRIDSKTALTEIRDFVASLKITKLSASDINDLVAFYVAPKQRPNPPSSQSLYSTLVMELTWEQGAGRETQVQPPIRVWQHYFGLNLSGTLPPITLINADASPPTVVRLRPSKHHHNYTIEIAGAHAPRPAILELRKLDKHTYEYRVRRPGTTEFNDRRRLLRVSNPLWTAGRLWQII